MHYIDLFMFSYQHSFRIGFEIMARNVLQKIGVDAVPKVLLVGARAPGSTATHPVCIEPEDGEWTLEPFSNLLDEIESIIPNHPLQNMCYGDEPRMRDKPENIRRSSVRMAVETDLLASDNEKARRSFVGAPVRVGEYYVVPVLQIPESVFVQFPPLTQPETDDSRIPRGIPCFVHACVIELLSEAAKELQLPEPGRGAFVGGRKEDEIARVAATNFMRTPAYMISQQYVPGDLFERFNLISSLMYEGLHGEGHLVLADPKCPSIDYLVQFKTPVPFREPRWARKVLQMASDDIALIADSEVIYGLGRLSPSHDVDSQSAFVVDFLDHYHWELRIGQQILLRSHYGEPILPKEKLSQERFVDNFSRLFPNSSVDARERIWSLFSVAIRQKHGCMIVVAADAVLEAKRLAQQGTAIEPVTMTLELLIRASGIDGTILVDPECVCYAIGVILDGVATPECTPSRGSRFNSGIRYVSTSQEMRLAVVVSDDHTVDVFPLLRPRIDRNAVERMVCTLEKATADNYHQARNWLDDHRFYLNANQCAKVNATLQRIEASLKGSMSIIVKVSQFKPDQDMNDSFFLPSN